MDLQQFLFLAAAVVFGLACRSFDNRYLRKAGWLAYLGASYMAGYFFTGSHVAGAFGVSLWFMLPWLEIVAYVRHLRFPLHNEMKHRFAPSEEMFPELGYLSDEMEEEGFMTAGDTGFQWARSDQFMRLFVHEELRIQAAIVQVRQEMLDLAFSYISLTSRCQDGRIFTTANFPLAPVMRFAPGHEVNRHLSADSLEELLQAHETFLAKNGVTVDDLVLLDEEELLPAIEREMVEQIEHNIHTGLLEPANEEGEIRYSWRGCFYLWFQGVLDMLRV